MITSVNTSFQQLHRFHHQSRNAEIVTIQPDEARFFLEKYNPINRKISQKYVDNYAEDMAMGQFPLSNDAIVFDLEGNVNNGQKRLSGCVKSNVPFETIILSGVPRQNMERYDGDNQRRTAHQNLFLQGVTRGRHMTAIANTWAMKENNWKSVRQTKIKELLVGSQRKAIDAIADNYSRYPQLRRAGFLLACAEFIAKDENAGKEFYDGVVGDGAGLESNSPILALRNVLLCSSGGSGAITKKDYGRTVYAIHKWRKKSTAKIVNQTQFNWDF